MNDLSSICLSCGLCCDGTLIGFVQLDEEEISRVRDVMPIEESHGQGFFVHPCSQLCGTSCQVYDRRPRQCASFECGLLKKVKTGAHDQKSAHSRIEHLKTLRQTLRQQLDQMGVTISSKSFYFGILEVEKKLRMKVKREGYDEQTRRFYQHMKAFEKALNEDFDLSL